jgi:translation initiation factor 4A
MNNNKEKKSVDKDNMSDDPCEVKTKNEYICETFISFDNMKLKPAVLKGIYAYGFEKPSGIQQKAIVPLAKGHDIIAQAQSGTGKTGTFAIGILERIDFKEESTQALILAPTRELASQIHTVIKALSFYVENLKIQLAIGGVNENDFNRWEKPKENHIIIGTPGRVLDNINRKKMNVNKLRVFALDEADEMLSRGFVDQIYDIFQHIPSTTQVALFSATLPKEVLELTKKFTNNPINILVKNEELTLEGIKQFYVGLDKRSHKVDTLVDLFEMISVTQCIIFVNKKNDAEELYEHLKKQGFGTSLITGSMPQEDRNTVIKNFRNGSARVLITTGLLARGFDVQQVSLVINFDLPKDKENYVHAAGRCGRFGRKGVVINLVTEEEYKYLQEIEKFYGTQIEEMPTDISKFFS